MEYKKCILHNDWNLCAKTMYDCADILSESHGNFNFTPPTLTPKAPETVPILFTAAENRANKNLCYLSAHLSRNLCENLCFSADFSYDLDENYETNRTKMIENIAATDIVTDNTYNQQKNMQCKEICMIAADMEVKEDCPFEKRCPDGCPCPGYKASLTEFLKECRLSPNILANLKVYERCSRL